MSFVKKIKVSLPLINKQIFDIIFLNKFTFTLHPSFDYIHVRGVRKREKERERERKNKNSKQSLNNDSGTCQRVNIFSFFIELTLIKLERLF